MINSLKDYVKFDINNSEDLINAFNSLERENQWGEKYIIPTNHEYENIKKMYDELTSYGFDDDDITRFDRYEEIGRNFNELYEEN